MTEIASGLAGASEFPLRVDSGLSRRPPGRYDFDHKQWAAARVCLD